MEHARNLTLPAVIVVGTALLASFPAAATITCNRDRDCWHTDRPVTYPNVTLRHHDDSWWDAHGSDRDYTWHEAGARHDWRHGYWLHGAWHEPG